MANPEPTTHVACGDPAMTPELQDALTLLRDRSDDGEFRTLVEDVLSGRCSLYDAAATPAFGAAVFGRVAQEFNARLAEMTEEEKQAFAAEGGADPAAVCADLHHQSLGEGAEPGEMGPCGSPCSTCTALCGKAGGHSH
jgi:hypothetical protein